MKHTHGEGALVLALLATVACSDPASRIVAPSSSREVVAEPSAAPTAERAALTKIARLVAEALDNEPARQHLKRDMRAALFREHKLQLTSYLQSKDGKTLLQRMAAIAGGDESTIFTSLAAIRPLEFYMPVAKHRETWKGKQEVLVVSQLDQATPIVAFDQTGKEVKLDRKVAPSQPTLSILPVETRFSEPMDAASSRNVRDENGEAIGTLESASLRPSSLIACGDECSGGGGGGGGGTPPIPPGLYLEFSRILDAKEPWFRGEPEIEVHVHGPTSTSAPRYGANLSCSGEHAYDYRKVFNQDDNFWQGRVLVFSNEETLAYTSKFTEGFQVLFWEDDNDSCEIKVDTNALMTFLQGTANGAGMIAIKLLPGAPWYIVAGAFMAQLFSNASWLQTDDDFLGVAVDQRQLGSPYPTNTHVIMDGSTLNGRATIVYR